MKNLFGRKSTLVLGIITILSAPIFMSCNSTPKEKLDDATTEVVDASEDLAKAKVDYVTEVEAFKADAERRIAENERKIEEYNADLKIKKTNALNKKIEELKMKTATLRKKLADFKADNKETWAEFKTEFNHDMEGLGDAFNDLTTQNTKK